MRFNLRVHNQTTGAFTAYERMSWDEVSAILDNLPMNRHDRDTLRIFQAFVGHGYAIDLEPVA